ncbi:MAG: glycosyltransferase family 8 protein [Hyphomicrobiales bacterium]|nr:MAG: glycosyltransferase family 8 protein [Hyphomicrobiales bacterium]
MKPNVVVLTCDAGYHPPALFVISELLRQKNRDFDIVLIRTDLDTVPPGLGPDGVMVIGVKQQLTALLSCRNDLRSQSAFARLFIDRWLPAPYRRVLYLDCDIWIETEDLNGLFAIDMQNQVLAAVRDSRQVFHGGELSFIAHKSRIGMRPSSAYFNSGVMLIDRQRWAADGIGEAAVAYLARGGAVDSNDQTVINAVVDGRWLELPPEWNWTYYASRRLSKELQPHIIHFVGSSKPWKDKRARYPAKFGHAMRDFYVSAGYPSYYQPSPLLMRLRRSASSALQGLRDLVLDRRGRVLERYVHATRFAKLADPVASVGTQHAQGEAARVA